MSRALVAQLRSTSPILTEQEVAQLALSIGAPRRKQCNIPDLHSLIEDALRHYVFDRWQQVSTKPTHVGKDCKSLIAACDRILATTLIEPDDGASRENLQSHLGAGVLFAGAAISGAARGEGAVMNALSAVEQLRRYAIVAAADAGRRPKKLGKPNDRPLKALVARLGECYMAAWSTPTVSRWGDVEDAPFVKFLAGINALLRARRLDVLRSAESLAKVWDRLPSDPTRHLVDERL